MVLRAHVVWGYEEGTRGVLDMGSIRACILNP